MDSSDTVSLYSLLQLFSSILDSLVLLLWTKHTITLIIFIAHKERCYIKWIQSETAKFTSKKTLYSEFFFREQDNPPLKWA